jgi:hypothetical protein
MNCLIIESFGLRRRASARATVALSLSPLRSSTGSSPQFRVEAARRDMPVKRLLLDLLDTIAADHLTGAILDDGDLPGA